MLYLTIVIFLAVYQETKGADLITTCPAFVVEGTDLDCECKVGPAYPGKTVPTFSWPGHALNERLVQEKVQRDQNGTVFRCEAQDGPNVTTLEYTLDVAYEAQVKSFTANLATTLEVDQMQVNQSPVLFSCNMTGLLPVTAWLVAPSGLKLNQAQPGVDVLQYTLTSPRCNDSGVYDCFTDNKAAPRQTSTVRLTVSCGPHPLNPSLPISPKPRLLTTDGMKIDLVAYPLPFIDIRYLGKTVPANYNSSAPVNAMPATESAFKVSCSPQKGAHGSEVVCKVVPAAEPDGRLGIFNLQPATPSVFNVSCSRGQGGPNSEVQCGIVPVSVPESRHSIVQGPSATVSEFDVGCHPRKGGPSYLVVCSIKPVSLPEDNLGVYSVLVSNRLGQWSTLLRVDTAIKEVDEGGEAVPSNGGAWMALATVFGTLFAAGLLAFIAFFLWKGLMRKKMRRDLLTEKVSLMTFLNITKATKQDLQRYSHQQISTFSETLEISGPCEPCTPGTDV